MTELNINRGEGYKIKGGVSILFSYSTPVAGWDDKGAFRTNKHYSATTTKHINKYLGGKDIGRKVDQEYIDSLFKIFKEMDEVLNRGN